MHTETGGLGANMIITIITLLIIPLLMALLAGLSIDTARGQWERRIAAHNLGQSAPWERFFKLVELYFHENAPRDLCLFVLFFLTVVELGLLANPQPALVGGLVSATALSVALFAVVIFLLWIVHNRPKTKPKSTSRQILEILGKAVALITSLVGPPIAADSVPGPFLWLDTMLVREPTIVVSAPSIDVGLSIGGTRVECARPRIGPFKDAEYDQLLDDVAPVEQQVEAVMQFLQQGAGARRLTGLVLIGSADTRRLSGEGNVELAKRRATWVQGAFTKRLGMHAPMILNLNMELPVVRLDLAQEAQKEDPTQKEVLVCAVWSA
jgi:hypothetical protein